MATDRHSELTGHQNQGEKDGARRVPAFDPLNWIAQLDDVIQPDAAAERLREEYEAYEAAWENARNSR